MLAGLYERIRGRLPELGLPPAREGDRGAVPMIVKSGDPRRAGAGTGGGSSCTALVFPEEGRGRRGGGRRPGVVVKLSQDPAGDERILAEHRNLTRLRSLGSPFLRHATPEPLALEEAGGRPALVLRAHPTAVRLKDRSPRSWLAPARAPEVLGRAAGWLGRLAEEAGTTWITLDDASIERLLAAPLERYLRELRPWPRERRALEERLARAGELRGLPLPLTPAHGDFCPANILEDRGSWIVIDWERPLEPRLPLGDLFHFLASLDYVRACGERRGNRGRNFSAAFLGESPYRRAVEECLLEACAGLGIPAPALDWLFLLRWIEGALEKLDYLRGAGIDPFAPGAGDFDEVMPVIRFHAGTCENVRETVERAQRLPWRAWGGEGRHGA